MICFLCRKSDSKIYSFTVEQLEKCKKHSIFRKVKHLKYHDLELPMKTSNEIGYHQRCYKNFTVLKRNFKDEFDAMFKEETVSR